VPPSVIDQTQPVPGAWLAWLRSAGATLIHPSRPRIPLRGLWCESGRSGPHSRKWTTLTTVVHLLRSTHMV